MGFRNLSAWSIRNPLIPLLLFAGLTLAGIISFMQMKVQNDPDIEFPVVIVVISQPGAAPTEMVTQITEKVESAVRSVEGVDQIDSTVTEGSSQTAIQFEIGEDVNVALNEVESAVDQIRGDLPDGILQPYIFKVSTSSNTMANYAIEADDMTMEQLSWFVDDTVSKQLLSVPGMASVDRRGGVDREIRVVLDLDRMQSLGITAAQVNAVLRQTNTDAGGGRTEIAGARQSVRVLGNADSAYDLGQRQIALGGGRSVRLNDIATVSDGYSEITRISKVGGKPVVSFGLTRAKGASDVAVYDEAQEVLKNIEKNNEGVRFVELSNNVQYTKDQYKTSMAAMIEGAVLAVVVVFLFLRDWRATFISALAIPLSAIPAFFFMDVLFGFSLNSMSLLALGLVAGVLVDDAIVEIENIVRHMRMGKSAYEASIDAADEIGIAVLATTLSIVAVFLPVGLMPGVAGQFFKNFGMTVVVAVLMSLAVARMITPLVAAYFMKDHGTAEHAGGWAMDVYLKVLTWTLGRKTADKIRAGGNRVGGTLAYFLPAILLAIAAAASAYMQAMTQQPGMEEAPSFDFMTFLTMLVYAIIGYLVGFLLTIIIGTILGKMFGWQRRGFNGWSRSWGRRILARLFDHRIWMMFVGVIAFGITILMLAMTPAQLFPDTDTDFVSVSISMVPGTPLERTLEKTEEAEKILLAQPETETALLAVREGDASIFLTLKDDRERNSLDYTREVAPLLNKIPDARISFQSNQQGPGGGSGRDMTIMLVGSDSEKLESAANKVVEEMKGMQGVVAPRVEADLQRPELIITPRTDIASQLGINTATLAQAIRIATIGEITQNAAKFSLSDRQVPIRVILPERSRESIETVRNLPVPTASGGSVPLSRVADITFGAGPTTIQRTNQNRRVFIGADIASGYELGAVRAKINELPTMKDLPQGVSTDAVGNDRFLNELMRDFSIALGSGILLVFSVLVLLYKRVMSPLVNMGSLLLAPLGGMIALKILDQPLSLPVFIGILMLFGIVAKNSILLIDFAIEEMANGVRKFEAIVDAGAKRAQPIVMTTVAMTAGMVPTAISLGGDGAWRAPMSVVVIGGLLLSTLLTLLIVPAGFSLADGIERRSGPWLRSKLLTYRAEGDERYETERAARKARERAERESGTNTPEEGPDRPIATIRGSNPDPDPAE